MYTPEIPLLPYDDKTRELGLAPWTLLEAHMDETGLSLVTRRNVRQTLTQAHRIATRRFLNPAIREYDYERPFLFDRPSQLPHEGYIPSLVAGEVDIAVDTLHGFIAINAFVREFGKRDDGKYPGYFRRVGPLTRNPITEFVNSIVAPSAI